jgi:glycosyltransferase involved in cell wall biosynthesis
LKFSIITATFNSAHFIEACILSIIRQNIDSLEIIIVDGLSSDSTIEKLTPIVESHPNISICSEKDFGIYDALNKGIEMASGDIIGFVHSDDLLTYKNVLSDIENLFINTNADGIYGDLEYVDQIDTNKIIRYWKSSPFHRRLLKKGWSPPHPTLFLKKSVYQKHGQFNLSYKISSDYDFMLRIFKDQELSFEYLPTVITKMRVGGVSNKNLKNILLKTFEDFKAIRNNKIGSLGTLTRKNLSKIKQFFQRKN